MIRARGKTIPPYAARLIAGLGRRAMTALKAGSSAPINSQLAANGHQVWKIRFNVSGWGVDAMVTHKLYVTSIIPSGQPFMLQLLLSEIIKVSKIRKLFQ